MMSSKQVLKIYLFFVIIIVKGEFIKNESVERYIYDVREIEVPLDHFNYVNDNVFKLRYLINETDRDDYSPILFYTGNEGDIELFAQNTGFMWELANDLKATVVFAEHRFYGKSLPFGRDSFNTSSQYGFLNAEQALADFAKLVAFLRKDRNIPVIAVGGSYGGMLAAWFRMKYPHIVHGALASSAPIWQLNKLTSCDIFSKIVTSVFTSSLSTNCSLNIQKSWHVFENYSTTESGRQDLQKLFNFCKPISNLEDLSIFLNFLVDVYENLAMVNYPYSNDFLTPLPAFPVREFCFYLKDFQNEDSSLLNALQNAISVYTNFTGTSKCLNYTSTFNSNLDENAWDIQTCNEMVMPMCSTKDSMFREKIWNFKNYSDDCYKKYKTRPRENELLLRYGGKNLKSVSNIIFSNGLLDPWSGGGVLQTTNNKIFVILIPEAAHHLDLRAAHSNDPKSVIEARKQELEVINQWLLQYKHFN